MPPACIPGRPSSATRCLPALRESLNDVCGSRGTLSCSRAFGLIPHFLLENTTHVPSIHTRSTIGVCSPASLLFSPFLSPRSGRIAQEGYELDEGVVNNAVKACCRAGRPSEAEAVLAKSLERGLVPEVLYV